MQKIVFAALVLTMSGASVEADGSRHGDWFINGTVATAGSHIAFADTVGEKAVTTKLDIDCEKEELQFYGLQTFGVFEDQNTGDKYAMPALILRNSTGDETVFMATEPIKATTVTADDFSETARAATAMSDDFQRHFLDLEASDFVNSESKMTSFSELIQAVAESETIDLALMQLDRSFSTSAILITRKSDEALRLAGCL